MTHTRRKHVPPAKHRKCLNLWRQHERELGGPPPLPWLRLRLGMPTDQVLRLVEAMKDTALLPAGAVFGVVPEGRVKRQMKRWAEGPGLFD